MYGKEAHFTEAVGPYSKSVLYANTDDRIKPIQPVKDDSIVVKTLRTGLCSSHDNLPIKLKKWKWPTRLFKIIYQLAPLSTPSCYLLLVNIFKVMY